MKKLLLFLFFIFSNLLSYSQIQCGTNAGFENGDFNGWQGDTGDILVDMNLQTYTITLNTPGIYNTFAYWANNHQITSGTLADWNTCNVVPYVCPWGGPYSARLGNGFMNCHAEDIYYTYRVDPNNPILIYAFAPVLQDPNHPEYAQPSFTSYVKDSVGNVVQCTYYRVTATNLRGQSLCNDQFANIRVYRDWKNVAVDLSAYAGQNVTVYFQTTDCGFCGHYGYAYLDIIGCYPKNIDINKCTATSNATLTAPPGFDRYQWSTGETTQSIVVNPLTSPNSITCTIWSVTGCQIVLTTRTNAEDPTVNFIGPNQCICDGPFQFTDLTISPVNPIISWIWDFGDGTTSTQQNPYHFYATPGNYTVTLTVRVGGLNGRCYFNTTRQINAYPCASISKINHN